MTGTKNASMIEGLMAELLAQAARTKRGPSTFADDAKADVTSLIQSDYGQRLRARLAREEVQEILAEARKKVWPHLNRRAARLVSPREFACHWSSLGIDFRLAEWSWPEGLALLGFYVRKTKGLCDRPVICVNTAHHPALVGAAFDHEMGHHLTAQIFGSPNEPHLLTYNGYAEHLDDPTELAADLLVSFAVYPQKIAQSIFGNAQKRRRTKDAGQELATEAFRRILNYLASGYGLNFDAKLSAEKRLPLLGALIHYTKLRRALLDEYDL